MQQPVRIVFVVVVLFFLVIIIIFKFVGLRSFVSGDLEKTQH